MQKQIASNRLPVRASFPPIQQTENKIIDIDGKIIDDSESEPIVYRRDFSESKAWLADRIATFIAGAFIGWALTYLFFISN
jgi:hypothetical protein